MMMPNPAMQQMPQMSMMPQQVPKGLLEYAQLVHCIPWQWQVEDTAEQAMMPFGQMPGQQTLGPAQLSSSTATLSAQNSSPFWFSPGLHLTVERRKPRRRGEAPEYAAQAIFLPLLLP